MQSWTAPAATTSWPETLNSKPSVLCSCGQQHILVAAMSHAGMDGTSGYHVIAALLARLGALASGARAAGVAWWEG